MPEVSIDAHEVRELAADFTRIPGELSRHAIPVLSKGALNIKNQMRDSFRESHNPGFRFVAQTVSYDLHTEGNELSAEIGPTKPEGALANVAIFGTPRGGGTVADPREALEAEAPRFEKALADLAEELFG
jgi:hypothetical protein